MRRIFLGPALHWLIVAILVGLCWLGGLERLHVTDFNPFIIGVIVVTLIALLVVLKTSKPGSQVTRDPVEDDETPPAA